MGFSLLRRETKCDTCAFSDGKGNPTETATCDQHIGEMLNEAEQTSDSVPRVSVRDVPVGLMHNVPASRVTVR